MTTPTTEVRDRYLDVLRCVAIARIIVYHATDLDWLTYAFPAMGVMFTLGGSLMANSLASPHGHAVSHRLRRLLPALWVFGAIVVTAMIRHEVLAGDVDDLPAAYELVLWLLPLVEPPGTEWAQPAMIVLWYLVAYLWLVVLSPLLLRSYRRWPLVTIALPLIALAGIEVVGQDMDTQFGWVVLNLATFGACWVVGFAHRDGRLRRIPLPALLTLAATAMAAGAWWAFRHPTESDVDLNEIPLAQGLYSLGFVLIALRWRPNLEWLRRARPLDGLVSAVNARAVTIYLWHNLAITAAFVVGDAFDVWRYGDLVGELACLAIAIDLIVVAVLGLGWVEDLAARRRPRLLPRLPHDEDRDVASRVSEPSTGTL